MSDSLSSIFPSSAELMTSSGADPEILKRGGALCRPPWLADEEIVRFQMVYKGQNNFRSCKFSAKHFYQCSQIFSILYTIKTCQ